MAKAPKSIAAGKSLFSTGNDDAILTRKNDIARALAGDDTVRGGVGDDTIYGGDGIDNLYGDEGNDLLFGELGADRLFGGVGNDTMFGGDGFDFLNGGDGNDVAWGGADNDRIEGGLGTNQIDGGTGVDILTYEWYTIRDQPLYVNLTAGYAVDRSGAEVGQPPPAGSGQSFSDTITGIENVFGSATTSNWLIGNAGDNVFFGGAESDYVNGRVGDDTIFTEAGSDTIIGGAGNDFVDGGASVDAFVFYKDDLSAVSTIRNTDIDLIRNFDGDTTSGVDPNGTSETIYLPGSTGVGFNYSIPGVVFLSISYGSENRYLAVQLEEGTGNEVDVRFSDLVV